MATGGLLLIAATITQTDADAAAPPRCYGAYATKWGGSGNDTLFGTTGNDVIVGLGGSDKIYGGGGNDIICGDTGNDLLVGGPGNDLIAGEEGADLLEGKTGKDRLRGFWGNDTLKGGPGDDTLEGGDGHNRNTNWGNDTLIGGSGKDTMRGSAGADLMTSAEDNRSRDLMDGYAGNDKLYAHDGKTNDIVRGRSGWDTCTIDIRPILPDDTMTGCELSNKPQGH
ncbi:calcium-binding protein [Streptomyces sp. GLT-R25]